MLDSLSLVTAGPVLMFLREACREHARGPVCADAAYGLIRSGCQASR
jgi:hypothetical protein